jgi:hypothetical protein
MRRFTLFSLAVLFGLTAVGAAAPPPLVYEKKPSREETILASLKATGLPTLDGKWYYIGPFENAGGQGFEAAYPPEKEIDLKKTYEGKGDRKIAWKEFTGFKVAAVNNLAKFDISDDCAIYLYQEVEVKEPVDLPVSLGSDDTLTLWLNGKQLVSENASRPAAADQNHATLKLKAGKNQLLVKICNSAGEWGFYIRPDFPETYQAKFEAKLAKDFPAPGATKTAVTAEDAHYRIKTFPLPKDCVLEVGGLAFRPDGKLLACTRRGEIWLVSDPGADDPADSKISLFASGLHEALGLVVDGKDIYVSQRPELTKINSRNGETADEFTTVCDKYGVSGDYHEFAFGPARDKDGNFFVTLNVGFGGGHQSKSPWRGWCVKISPKGELTPWATGLRSPNGVNFSPDGDLFYVDNQGEWVATCKMHQIKQGEYYGHPAGLRWVTQSPFAKTIPDKHESGMMFDGQKGQNGVSGMPPFTQPCVWFPYQRMGNSASEPRWDTTAGKFGPFTGQCFVGDQTKSMIMRVDLEKVNGKYQGACFPFRSGFECGINRMVFGPDGSLYVGMTNRGWGSLGGKPYGLQRLVYTGVTPFEIYSMHVKKDGFELSFTKPLDVETAEKLKAYNMLSFTHYYWGTYGSPEVDKKAEKVESVKVSEDGKKVTLVVPNLKAGRIYELHLDGVKSKDGDPVLHPEGYYTLNDLP